MTRRSTVWLAATLTLALVQCEDEGEARDPMRPDAGGQFDGSTGGGGAGGQDSGSTGGAGVAGQDSGAAGSAGGGGQDAGSAGATDAGDPDADAADAGGQDADSGSAPDAGSGDAGSADAAADTIVCVPTVPATEVCDDVDNDCDGQVDNVDVGQDGIQDCLRVVFIGAQGGHASTDLQLWLGSNSVSLARIHTTLAEATTLTMADLSGIDIVILDNLARLYTPSESDELLTWVQNGGGLVSMNGHVLAPDHRDWGNSILASFGIEHLAGFVSGPITDFAAHPVTAGLTSITFNGGFRVAQTTDASVSITPVAMQNSEPVAVVQEQGAGRVFVWGDDWVQYDSVWQASPELMQFWVNALLWLTHVN